MEEPGGLQSMGSQRVGQDWETSLTHFTHILQLFLSFPVLVIIHLLLSREARHSVLLCHILSQPPNTFLHGIVFNIIFVLHLLIRRLFFFFPPCIYKRLVYSNSSGDLAEFIFPVGALLLLWVPTTVSVVCQGKAGEGREIGENPQHRLVVCPGWTACMEKSFLCPFLSPHRLILRRAPPLSSPSHSTMKLEWLPSYKHK